MIRRLFITGTDTGVGKTRVGCAIAAAFSLRGERIAVLKPVETGCASDGTRLLPADAIALRAAAGLDASLDLVCPHCYAPPVSPAIAARDAGRPVDLATIDAAAATLEAAADLLLVEGAGGLLVPLDREHDMAYLVARLGARLLLVARAGLGTINHTLLTLEAARHRGLDVVGVVLNRLDTAADPSLADNAQEIATRGRVPVLGSFPCLPGPLDRATLAALAERHLDLAALRR